ncbi:unnamed protein product [Rhodiola kirilowii]
MALTVSASSLPWLFSITLLFLTLFGPDKASGQCLEHQKSLLMRLNSSLEYQSQLSSKLVSWDSGQDCCLWHGVTCNEDGYVTGLDLSFESLTGGLNDSSPLFELQHLISLNLAHNFFNGAILPPAFGKLFNLVSLNLSTTSFSGQIPVEISNLTRLATLDFTSSYSLKVENPNLRMLFGNLSKLAQLRLDNVNLSAQSNVWCQDLSYSLPSLQVLSLCTCRLSGPIHASLRNLKSLSHIDLSFNNFSAPFPRFFSNFKNLTSLILTSCHFHGSFLEAIIHVQTLRHLDLSSNNLVKGNLPIYINHSSPLETLILSATTFANTIPEWISQLRMLSTLELCVCNLNGHIPKSISQLTNIAYLDLSFNNLSGSVPSFSLAKNLTKLNLSSNQLSGSLLSTDWNELSQIVRVDMSYNFLSGSIPTSLFTIPSLEQAYLGNNHFVNFTRTDESISMFSSKLRILDLNENNLQGSFPAFIYKLQALTSLYLMFNNFSSTVQMSSLLGLQNLTSLYLSHSNFSVEIGKDIPTSCPQIIALMLSSCKLKEFPSFLRNQSSLEYLDLSQNLIQGDIPDWIWNIHTLENLNLSHNSIQKLTMPVATSNFYYFLDLSSNMLHGSFPNVLPTVEFLDLSNNNLSSMVPFNICASLSSTMSIILANNKLHGNIPPSVCNATLLQVLDLSYNLFSGLIPQCLTQLQSLAVLNLRRNNISGIIPDSFPPNCTLHTLNLNTNSLQGVIPKSLRRCASLEVLDLGYNNLQDIYPCMMGSISNLSVLVLRSNSLFGSIQCPSSDTSWSRLQILDVASNKFNGSLPSQQLMGWKAMLDDKGSSSKLENLHYKNRFAISGPQYYQDSVSITVKGYELMLVKILTIYTSIDFSDNKFEGQVPNQLGYLKSLFALNLSHNGLKGQIPSSFGNLRIIESLDMASNELSGSIPPQLAHLRFLNFLNVSSNNLEGMIPVGSQFQTFSEASFMGNKGLCGFPLITKCKGDTVGSLPDNRHNKDGGKLKEFIISTEIGFAVGLGLVLMPLLFWPRWRNAYNILLEIIVMRMLCHRRTKPSSARKNMSRRN